MKIFTILAIFSFSAVAADSLTCTSGHLCTQKLVGDHCSIPHIPMVGRCEIAEEELLEFEDSVPCRCNLTVPELEPAA